MKELLECQLCHRQALDVHVALHRDGDRYTDIARCDDRVACAERVSDLPKAWDE